MKASLQINQRQQLALTPQLQMAINLLQLSTVELSQAVQEAVANNPLLELDDKYNEDSPSQASDEFSAGQVASLSTQEITANNIESQALSSMVDQQDNKILDLDAAKTIPSELAVDTNWDDIFDYSSNSAAYKNTESGDFLIDKYSSHQTTIQDHLMWQLIDAHFSDDDNKIAIALIDAINADGFLTSSLEDVAAGLDEDISIAKIEKVLAKIQRLEPIGVGARDLKESLLIQLQSLPADTIGREIAINIINEELEKLAEHDYQQLKHHYHLSQAELEQAVKLIQSLNPRPGSELNCASVSYVVPDVVVKKNANRWCVELNDDIVPRVHINQYYAVLNKMADKKNMPNKQDLHYIRNNLQDARFFLRSLQNRQLTLLRVASYIIEHQVDFLEHGPVGLRPLVLRDVADILGLHESTISRITTNKYIATPRGVFELKYFFSNSVGDNHGEQCAATAIRAYIKKLIDSENPVKPLSDHRIAEHLEKRGLQVARRTIAKYREALLIPAAHKRKKISH